MATYSKELFSVIEGENALVPSIPMVKGQLILTRDTKEILHDTSRNHRTRMSDLPIVTTIKFNGKQYYGVPSGVQCRQPFYATLEWGQSSVRPLIIDFDKPIGQNCFLQPFVYNRLPRNQCETSGPTGNQLLFRSWPRGRQKKKGWSQVNISKNIQSANGYGGLIPMIPIFTDGSGNKFYRDGIIRLAPGIKQIVIPADYLMKQLIVHTRRRSGRRMRGAHLSPNYAGRIQYSAFTPTNMTWYAVEDCMVTVEVQHASGSTHTLYVNNVPVQRCTYAAGGSAVMTAQVKVSDQVRVDSSTAGSLAYARLYKVPLIRSQELPPDQLMDPLHRSPRSEGETRPGNIWLSPKSYIKFAVSEYIAPVGIIGQPTYRQGQYTHGILSSVTLTSHRYKTKNGMAVWVTDLLER